VKTLLFVHGTGVRSAGLEVTLNQIRWGLAERHTDCTVLPCSWGEDVGARLSAEALCLPRVTSARGLNSTPPDSDGDWLALVASPQIGLDFLFSQVESSDAPRTAHPLRNSYQRATHGLHVKSLEGNPLQDYVARSIEEVLTHEIFARSELGSVAPEELANVFAEAVVATALFLSASELEFLIAVDGGRRDRAIQEIAEAVAPNIGKSPRGFRRVVARNLLRLGPQQWLNARRQHLTSTLSPIAGDVLLYQAKGDRLRHHIGECRDKILSDVIVLGHSLGGIASFEALIGGQLLRVETLITVGSQVSYLYELDALSKLGFGARLPVNLPRWINIHDPNDILSFPCEKLFPGQVEDVRTVSKQPFPLSHSAYFDSPAALDVIADTINDASRK
jgi:hypothetical protein